MYYRLFELDDKGNLKTLLHSVNSDNKTRKLPVNQWVESEKRAIVKKHRNKQGEQVCRYLYDSGFHVFEGDDYSLAYEYLQNFRNERQWAIAQVEVEGIRQKPTNENVLLVDKIKILGDTVELLK